MLRGQPLGALRHQERHERAHDHPAQPDEDLPIPSARVRVRRLGDDGEVDVMS
ncbi:hypothetical protein J7E95_32725 [Streptomyces sp. ISL-14]|nr:hypothetical protein [Streptomyces sp. ISL-14]